MSCVQLQDRELLKVEEAIAESGKKQEKALQEALEVSEVVKAATYTVTSHSADHRLRGRSVARQLQKP